MKKLYFRDMTLLAVASTILGPSLLMAGNLDSSAGPTGAGSAMYGTVDVFSRLQTGAPGTKRSGSFTEATAAPAVTGKTFNEIMAVAPVMDNAKGASPADVSAGKAYWSVRTDSRWGLQAGTGSFSANSYSAPVAKSGQTVSYVAGDDGAKQKGVASPAARFADNGNGTITDTLTGLIWLKNANCFGATTWSGALTAAATLNSGECGLTDSSVEGNWRLPQVEELSSLIDYGKFSPSLPTGHPFTASQSAAYWSATTVASTTANAMTVNLGAGSVDSQAKTVSTSTYTFPVRGDLGQ